MSSARQGASDHAHGTCDPATCPECAAYAKQESEAPSTAKEAPQVDSPPYYDPVTGRCPHGTRYPHECRDGCEGADAPDEIDRGEAELSAEAIMSELRRSWSQRPVPIPRCPTCYRRLDAPTRCFCGVP